MQQISASSIRKILSPIDVEKRIGILDRCAAVLKFLRKVKPTVTELVALNLTYSRWVEMFCSNILCESFAESYHPEDASYPPPASFTEAVHLVQSSESDYVTLERQRTFPLLHLLTDMFDRCAGVSLFVCDNSHVGISYPGVRVGDIVSVFFGCSHPIVIRPLLQRSASTPQSWEMVSVAKLAGLMNGEAMYGNRIPRHWRPVRRREVDHDHFGASDVWRYGFYDTEADTLRTDPAEILNEMGIKVDKCQKDPYRLEVRAETLRAAGVLLREFIIE
jgi:hypothetical protein